MSSGPWRIRTGGSDALYRNDDNLLIDLLSEYEIGGRKIRIRGGLLGHWSVWTKRAVELLDEIHPLTDSGEPIPPELLTRAMKITDATPLFLTRPMRSPVVFRDCMRFCIIRGFCRESGVWMRRRPFPRDRERKSDGCIVRIRN